MPHQALRVIRRLLGTTVLALAFSLAGCGGSGGGDAPADTDVDFVEFVKGMIEAGPQPDESPVDINNLEFKNVNPEDPDPYGDLFD